MFLINPAWKTQDLLINEGVHFDPPPPISLLNISTEIFICMSMGHYKRFLRDILKLKPRLFSKITIPTAFISAALLSALYQTAKARTLCVYLICTIKYKIKRKIVNCEKTDSVTSHDLHPLPLPCHKLSHFSDPFPLGA